MLKLKNTVRKPTLDILKRSYANVANEPFVLKENKSIISRLTLNRPSVYNSCDTNTISALKSVLQEVEEDPNTKAIFFRGKGKAFCSGADVKYFLELYNGKVEGDSVEKMIDNCYDQIYRHASLKTPLIPVLDGMTMGFGNGLTMYAPFRIVTENTKYAMPETAVGIFCDATCPYYLSRLDGHLGKYLTMTGNFLNGEDVLFAGLGTHFVPSSRIDQLEEHMSQEKDLDLDKINSIIQEYSVDESHNPKHYTLNKENRSIIDRCLKYDTAEEIMEALKSDGTEFASNIAKTILERSPSCTKINAENFNRAKNYSFVDVIKNDIMLWSTIIDLPDFSQGIHARMVLKKKPEWNPSRIDDVDLDYLRKNIYRDGVTKRDLPFPHDEKLVPNKFQKYILPTRKDILEAQEQHGLNTLEQTVSWFQRKHNNKFGVRQKIESLI